MRISTCLAFSVALLHSTGMLAQLPVPAPATPVTEHHLFLDVQTVASGGSTSTAGQLGNATGKSSRDTEHSTTLRVSVRNTALNPDQVQIQWVFFGKDVKDKNEKAIDSGSKDLPLAAQRQEQFDIVSKAVVSSMVTQRTTKYENVSNGNGTTTRVAVTDDVSHKEGTRLTGWVVRVMADGKVLDARASDPKYNDFAKNAASLTTSK